MLKNQRPKSKLNIPHHHQQKNSQVKSTSKKILLTLIPQSFKLKLRTNNTIKNRILQKLDNKKSNQEITKKQRLQLKKKQKQQINKPGLQIRLINSQQTQRRSARLLDRLAKKSNVGKNKSYDKICSIKLNSNKKQQLGSYGQTQQQYRKQKFQRLKNYQMYSSNIQMIVGKGFKKSSSTIFYLVKWKSYNKIMDLTWENLTVRNPASRIKSLIRRFQRNHMQAIGSFVINKYLQHKAYLLQKLQTQRLTKIHKVIGKGYLRCNDKFKRKCYLVLWQGKSLQDSSWVSIPRIQKDDNRLKKYYISLNNLQRNEDKNKNNSNIIINRYLLNKCIQIQRQNANKTFNNKQQKKLLSNKQIDHKIDQLIQLFKYKLRYDQYLLFSNQFSDNKQINDNKQICKKYTNQDRLLRKYRSQSKQDENNSQRKNAKYQINMNFNMNVDNYMNNDKYMNDDQQENKDIIYNFNNNDNDYQWNSNIKTQQISSQYMKQIEQIIKQQYSLNNNSDQDQQLYKYTDQDQQLDKQQHSLFQLSKIKTNIQAQEIKQKQKQNKSKLSKNKQIKQKQLVSLNKQKQLVLSNKQKQANLLNNNQICKQKYKKYKRKQVIQQKQLILQKQIIQDKQIILQKQLIKQKLIEQKQIFIKQIRFVSKVQINNKQQNLYQFNYQSGKTQFLTTLQIMQIPKIHSIWLKYLQDNITNIKK